uniref:Uncharacterized protein n=1 Tax=Peronospora matthiolae TaxID=2874970 RepID=A0AAV1U7S5_9STRA
MSAHVGAGVVYARNSPAMTMAVPFILVWWRAITNGSLLFFGMEFWMVCRDMCVWCHWKVYRQVGML